VTALALPSIKRPCARADNGVPECPGRQGEAVVNVDKFRQEHLDLLGAVALLREFVQAGVPQHADAICKQLLAMAGTIKLHLAAEDRVLYPALAQADDPFVAHVGRKFQQEMGGIAEAFAAFVARWNLASKIAADPAGFKDEANAIFKALHTRVQRENRDLYPLAEMI
jgi:hypothetical protein